jgi:DNA-directed RNA polymerase specialized sigma24 family protein
VMRIHRGAESFRDRGPGTFRSWCIKIAQRVLQDLWRGRLTELDGGLSPKFGVTDLVPFEEIEARFGGGLVTGSFAEHEALCTRGPDEEEPTMSVEAQLAAEAFATLSSIDQTVLWCKVMHEDSDARVSEITGKPVDQVRKIRFKALDRLIRRFQRLMAAAGQEAL